MTKTEQYGGLGRAVFVAHGFGVTTVYGHLSRINVTPGQRVERGAIVGLVGNTGRATGYHLHYEVQVNGAADQPAGLYPRSRRRRSLSRRRPLRVQQSPPAVPALQGMRTAPSGALLEFLFAVAFRDGASSG